MAVAPITEPTAAELAHDHVQVRTSGDAIVVRPTGSVEALPWELMEEASTVLLAPLHGRPVPRVVFDLAELQSGGSVLLTWCLLLTRSGASIWPCCGATDGYWWG